jgi:hypothetical protein
MQLLHCCEPLGCSWYFASAFENFSGNTGAAESEPLEQALKKVIGITRLQLPISKLRNTALRDMISSCPVSTVREGVLLMLLLMPDSYGWNARRNCQSDMKSSCHCAKPAK